MVLTVNTNIASLTAQRHLTSSVKTLNTAAERLSSGRRINSAADDAAGLSISNRLTTQVRGLSQAIRNANDGISLIQTAEGALGETSNLLQRMRELSIQSANGIYSDTDRATLDSEVQQLIAEVDRIAETTSFNGRTILDGSHKNVALQVGVESNQTVEMSIAAADASSLGAGSGGGDVIGAAMSLGSDGDLIYGITEGEVLINGQQFDTVDAGDSLQTLVDRINEQVSGVTATTQVVAEASSVGDGVLEDSESLSLTVTTLAGNSQTFTVADTSSLSELAAKIETNSGNLVNADINDEGKLVLTGTDIASLNVSDSAGATGLSASSSSGGSVHQNVINGLTTSWIREAEDLITNALTGYGLTLPSNIHIDLIFAETDGTLTGDLTGISSPGDIVSDGQYGRIAAVFTDPSNMKLIIDLADFSTPEGSAWLYNDRVIAHEMVHAAMVAIVPSVINNALPGWFSEGIAEFIHGADERVIGDIQAEINKGDSQSQAINDVVAAITTSPGSPSDSLGYSAGYVAVRMLHDELVANGGSISDILVALDGGSDLDTAIAAQGISWDGGGGGTGLNEFVTDLFNEHADEYIADALNGTTTYGAATLLGTAAGMDLTDGDGPSSDTGSIAGISALGSSVLTATSVLPNTATGGPQYFDLDLPDGFSATNVGFTAQLVLSSADGSDIKFSRGSSGTLNDLTALGFRESRADGVINGVGITDASTAWSANEISINGVSVDVDDTDSLAGKIAAINKITDQTGVVAETFTSGTLQMANFDFDTWTGNSWGDFTINGIVMTGIGNDATSEDMIDTINNFSYQTGVSARLKGSDIILESTAGLIFGNHPTLGPTAALAFGASNGGNAQFISSADEASGAEASAVQSGTTSEAGIKLRSTDGSPIQLELGDTSSSLTGLLETGGGDTAGSGGSLSRLNVASQSSAQKAIGIIDNALETINSVRSELGAVNNRLTFTIASLANAVETSAAARSRILDTDFAQETSNLSRAQIIQQAASAMLVQANAQPQSVLSLIAA